MFPIRAGCPFCLALALTLSSLQAAAQETEPPTPPDKKEHVPPQVEVIEPTLHGVRDEQGKLHIVPGLTLKKLQHLLKLEQQVESGKPTPPRYSITELQFEGHVKGDRAEFQATVSIRVLRDGWIRVPLRMAEALAVRAVREEGRSTPVLERTEDEGLVWWAQGRKETDADDNGERQLRLKLTVPVRTLAGERVLVLTPPDAVPSELRLSVPLDDVVARAADAQTAVTTAPAGDGTTLITAGGLRQRLELSWLQKLKPAGDVAPVLEATGLLDVEIDDETVRTQATLQIQSLQGQFDRFAVQVPPGTEPPPEGSLKGAKFEFAPAPEGGGLLKVQLNEPTADPVTVQLIARSPAPPMGGPLRIEGFSVVEAERQTGQVAVRRQGDWSVRTVRSRRVHRVDIASLHVSIRNADVLAGFEYVRQPFELDLELRRLEPRIEVEPRYTLLVESDRATLDATLEYSIERGGLLETELSIPPGWQLDEIGPASLIDPGEQTLIEGDRLNLQFLTRTSDQFRLHLRVHRSFAPNAGALVVAFPVPRDTIVLPAHLAVVAAANVGLSPSFELMPGLTPSLRNESPRFKLPSDLPPWHRSPLFFRLDASTTEFQTEVFVEPQRVEVQSRMHLALEGMRAEIKQTLSYEISFSPLSEFALLVPEEAAESLAVESELGTPVLLKRDPAEAKDGLLSMRAILGQQRIGPVELVLTYRIPIDFEGANGDFDLVVPVIMPAEPALRVNRATVSVPPSVAVALRDENWTETSDLRSEARRSPNVYETAAFEAGGPRSHLTLVLTKRELLPAAALIISRAWIRVGVAPDGSQNYRSHYRFTTRDTALVIRIPRGFDPNSFRFQIDGSPVEALQQVDGSLRVALPPLAVEESRVLTAYAPRPALPGLEGGKRSVSSTLEFPEGTLVEQTYYQVHLPTNEYLISGTPGFTEEWDWRRVGLTWVRSPRLSDADLSAWIGGSVAQETIAFSPRGNVYLFGYVGSVRQLDLRITSPASLVLAASGTAFLLGVLPLYFRFARNRLLGLILVTALALVGVAHPGPAVLFLQSATLGMSLVALASVIKTVLDRRHRGVVVPADSASSFGTIASTLTHAHHAAGSEGSTGSALAANFKPESESHA